MTLYTFVNRAFFLGKGFKQLTDEVAPVRS